MGIGLAFIGAIVLFIVFLVGIYNNLVTLRNRFKNAFAQIDVQLKRRYDLIPNLVETAKGYMKHERETLEAVIGARNQAALAPGRRLPVADSGEAPGPWEDPVDYAEVAMAETGDFEGLPEMPEAAQAAIPPAPPPEPLPENPVVEPTPLQTPEAVREAARVLAQPTRPQAPSADDIELPAWSPPPPPDPVPPVRRPAPAPPPEPRGPRMVPVGPQRVAGMDWDQDPSLDAPSGRRQSQVATERRRGPRIADRKNVAPVSQLVAGAVGTLLSLGVVGYLVVVLL